MTFAVRVVCLTMSLERGVSLRESVIQQTIASMSWDTAGVLLGRQIMSPREMSISSSIVSVTDIGEKASATSPSAVRIFAMRVDSPDGRWVTSSPGLRTPPANWPA